MSLETLRQTANKGDPVAQFRLGVRLAAGRVTTQQAAGWIRRAAEQGSDYAARILGVMIENGRGERQDQRAALHWFRQAQDKNCSIAEPYCLGSVFEHGEVGFADKSEYLEQIRFAAEQGLAEAEHLLGVMHQHGNCVPFDFGQAETWFKRAAAQELGSASYLLAKMYQFGRRGVAKDIVLCIDCLQKSAAQGYPRAHFELGQMYAAGRELQQDDRKAEQMFRHAAQQGMHRAQNALEAIYDLGRGLPEEVVGEAADHWRERTESDPSPFAHFALGLILDAGRGVDRNEAAAAEAYQRASEEGLAAASYHLAIAYANGCGLKRDDARAVELLQRAAKGGVANASLLLGLCYEVGRGVRPDSQQADKWREEASMKGHGFAALGCPIYYHCDGEEPIDELDEYEPQASSRYLKGAQKGFDQAQRVVAEMYADGRGVPKSWWRAWRWRLRSSR